MSSPSSSGAAGGPSVSDKEKGRIDETLEKNVREPISYSYRVVRRLCQFAVWAFFKEVRIIGLDRLPNDRAIVLASTHSNMGLDPAVLIVSTRALKSMVSFW